MVGGGGIDAVARTPGDSRALWREVAARLEAEIDDRWALGLGEDGRAMDRALLHVRGEFALGKIQRVFRERAVGTVGALAVIIGNVG